jgi:hypothetical protein
MRKFVNKGAVVVGATLVVCAFVVPSMASALSWGTVPSEHILTVTDLAFLAHTPGGNTIGAACHDSTFTSDVKNASVLTFTSAEFSNCVGIGTLAAGCTATPVGTGFPWTVTGPTTNNVQIHGIDIDVSLEPTPSGTTCPGVNLGTRVTGTLTGGTWTSGPHSIDLPINGGGLVAHVGGGLGTLPMTFATGSQLIDRQQTLTLS